MLALIFSFSDNDSHAVAPSVTYVFCGLLVALILCLAFEEKLHAKKSIIAGAFAGQQSIQFWVWPKPDSGTWDAEFVFFTDQGSDEDVRAAFEQVHVLAEMARENSPASECVLSGSETGDPREEKGRSWTVWW